MRNFQGEFWAGTKILLMDSTNRTPVLIIVYMLCMLGKGTSV